MELVPADMTAVINRIKRGQLAGVLRMLEEGRGCDGAGQFGLACRVFRTAEGLAGSPSVDMFTKALASSR